VSRCTWTSTCTALITAGLRLRGVDVLTAQDDGRRHVPDNVLLDRAADLLRVLFSQDEDLLAEATRRQREGIAFAGVVYGYRRPRLVLTS